MTPEQKIKATILLSVKEDGYISFDELNDANVDELYNKIVDEQLHWDYQNEVRYGETETNIKPEYSRHYESKSVAAKMFDGSWVGWTYWYGGGKHSEPEAIEWMKDAYELDMVEETKTIVVQNFSKKVI